jgi:hypothetical protein
MTPNNFKNFIWNNISLALGNILNKEHLFPYVLLIIALGIQIIKKISTLSPEIIKTH